jgi:tRNA A-37 threonylcarbamoyl transferase component Bud32
MTMDAKTRRLEAFLEAANRHEPCVLEWDEDGVVFRCEVDARGTFTKTCVRDDTAGSEPALDVERLVGKAMTATFELGQLPREWVTTVTGGLGVFEGDLAPAIYDFLLTLYDSERDTVPDRPAAEQGRCPSCGQLFDLSIGRCPLHGHPLARAEDGTGAGSTRDTTARAGSRLVERLLAGGPVVVLQVFVFRDGVYLGSDVFGDQVVIGAGPEADLRLDGPKIDDIHAIVRCTGGELSIQPVGGPAGTAINRVFIAGTRRITARDEIQIGAFTLKVRVGGPPAAAHRDHDEERPRTPMRRKGSCPVCSRAFELDRSDRKPRCPEHGRLLIASSNAEAPSIPIHAPVSLVEPPVVARPRPITEGDQVGRYRIGRVLSDRGSQARIHLAVDTSLGRTVVIKVFRLEGSSDEKVQLERFVREPNLLARIQHQNVVTVFEFLPEVPAIVMEHIEGVSLAVYLAAEHRIGAGVVEEILGQACAGVEAAHDVGLIHRDLKPANIMLTSQATGFRVRVLDFGVARDQGRVTKLSAGFAGTMAYAAPEQWAGKNIGRGTDVYALGIIAYESLTGRLPFRATSPIDLMHQHQSEDPAPFPEDLDEDALALEPVVRRALAKHPADRYASALDLGRALANPPPRRSKSLLDRLFR